MIGTADENKCTNYSDTYNFIGLCFIRLTKMFLSLFFNIINVTWINGRLFLFQVYILLETRHHRSPELMTRGLRRDSENINAHKINLQIVLRHYL